MVERSDGLKIWGDLGDYGVCRPAMFGLYEAAETRFILDHIKPGDCFLDVGANCGWFTLTAARADADVIAIEPRIDTARYLARSVAANGFTNVTVIAAAAGSAVGQGSIACHTAAGNSGGTWFVDSARPDFRAERAASGADLSDIQVVTIDEIVGERKIALMKIDIEGAEPLALAGAVRTIERSRPIILSEVNPIVLRAVGQMEPEEYVKMLCRQGYEAWCLSPEGLRGEPLSQAGWPFKDEWRNVIFEPRSPDET